MMRLMYQPPSVMSVGTFTVKVACRIMIWLLLLPNWTFAVALTPEATAAGPLLDLRTSEVPVLSTSDYKR